MLPTLYQAPPSKIATDGIKKRFAKRENIKYENHFKLMFLTVHICSIDQCVIAQLFFSEFESTSILQIHTEKNFDIKNDANFIS